MIHVRSNEEIEIIRENALMVTATLTEVAAFLKPGIKTKSINEMAETFIMDTGGKPSFKGYHGFPAALCISVNEVVVHGFPSDYELKDGDIISVDCGFYRKGFHGDHAYTFGIGNVAPEVLEMMRITKESLAKGIFQAKAHSRVGDISWAIEEHTTKEKFEQQLLEAGFSINDIEDASKAIIPSVRRLYTAWFLGFIPTKIYQLFHPNATELAKRNVDTAYYQYKTLKKRLWKYLIFSAEKK